MLRHLALVFCKTAVSMVLRIVVGGKLGRT